MSTENVSTLTAHAEALDKGVGCDALLADLKRARSRLYRMELHARKHRGNNTTYCEGKCEGESIGLRFALREIDKILESANKQI